MKTSRYTTDDPFLSPPQVARELGLSVRTIRQYMRDGMIPSIKIGRHWRIRRSALEAYLASLTQRRRMRDG
jgi:excisionase family DNA binding protein